MTQRENDVQHSGANEQDYIFGRNTVLSFLETAEKPADEPGQLDKIFLAEGSHGPDKRIDEIKKLARQNRVPVVVSNKLQLEKLVGRDSRHQGVVARLSHSKALTLLDLIQIIEEKTTNGTQNTNILLALVDGIQDPQNLGTIIRAAQAAGAVGLITTFRRSAGTTGAVAKASAGALAKLPIVKVNNLVSAIEELKKHRFWIAGLAADAKTSVFQQDLRLPLAVIIGSEGSGIGRLVAEHCDFLLKIPMAKDCESLNAAVAAGIVFFEHRRQNYEER